MTVTSPFARFASLRRPASKRAPRRRRGLRGIAPLAAAAGLLAAGVDIQAADTAWTGGGKGNAWSDSTNWSKGVPDATTNALTTTSGADISLGSGAQAKTLFVEGPLGGESKLTNGDLTLADQLWINIKSGTGQGSTVPLRLQDAGGAPVAVTANNVTLAADPGTQGGIFLDSQAKGNVSLSVTDTLTIGYDGSGSFVSNLPAFGSAHGTSSITANTIRVSVTAGAGSALDYNRIETTNAGQTVTATNLQLGIAGQLAVATAQAGSWSIGNTVLGVASTGNSNELTVTGGGSFTNAGAFTVGVEGANNFVNVGNWQVTGDVGTLQLTGPDDLVIGSGANSHGNSFNVYNSGSTLTATGNVIVGLGGDDGDFRVYNGSSATSGGARLGVNVGSDGNAAAVNGGSTWTINGSVRVGDKGGNNQFFVDGVGSTVTLTAPNKNFYVGYDKSASNNIAAVINGGTLSVKAAGADLVVSGNVTGSGPDSLANALVVYQGGIVDANRTLVGSGGEIWGLYGTIKGDTFIGPGGKIAPGIFGGTLLQFTDNVDFSSGGLYAAVTDNTTQSSMLDILGALTLGGTSALDITSPFADPSGPFVIAHYGSLTGEFTTVTGLPASGWFIDYNYLGLNEIAIVGVPEIDPASFGSAFVFVVGALGLAERKRRRVIG